MTLSSYRFSITNSHFHTPQN